MYRGIVSHRRLQPFGHKFAYRVFSVLVDTAQLGELGTQLKRLSYNRANILSIHDRDHGPKQPQGASQPLYDWICASLREAGLYPNAPRIFTLCYPRLWGYVFNPLTVHYVYETNGADRGRLTALLYEVHNTFGDRHSYLIPVAPDQAVDGPVTQRAEKNLYVSPFLPMEGRYRFRMTQPLEQVTMLIRQFGATGEQMCAVFSANWEPLSDRTLMAAVARHPLMTLKVMGGIHWEALRLWRKGARYHRRPTAPEKDVTLIRNGETAL